MKWRLIFIEEDLHSAEVLDYLKQLSFMTNTTKVIKFIIILSC